MFKNLLPSLRKKSFVMEDLPETIAVPSYGNKPEIQALSIEIATVDDIAQGGEKVFEHGFTP